MSATASWRGNGCGKHSGIGIGSAEIHIEDTQKASAGRFGLLKEGASGGYRLNMSAAPFTLRCVIELIDGPLAISKCVDGNCGCSMLGDDKSECAIHHIFQAISEDLSEKLGRITIADVTESNADIGALINKLNGAHGTAKYDMRRQRY